MRQEKDKRQVALAEKEFEERVVTINHITKVVKGGRRYRFSAVVVVGDGKGRVGLGDGVYDVYTYSHNGDIVGIEVVFISDEDDE